MKPAVDPDGSAWVTHACQITLRPLAPFRVLYSGSSTLLDFDG